MQVEKCVQDGLDPILCDVLFATASVMPAVTEGAEAEASSDAPNPVECITRAAATLQDRAAKVQCMCMSTSLNDTIWSVLDTIRLFLSGM